MVETNGGNQRLVIPRLVKLLPRQFRDGEEGDAGESSIANFTLVFGACIQKSCLVAGVTAAMFFCDGLGRQSTATILRPHAEKE